MKFSKMILAGMLCLCSSAVFSLADAKTQGPIVRHIELNPGLDAQVNILPLKKYDSEKTYEVTKLPDNATLYYDGEKIEESGFIVNDPNKVAIDPEDGDVTVIFDYIAAHDDGRISKPRSIIMRFSDLHLSGSVFHDSDGNGKVDGKALSNLDGKPLYISIINKDEKILSSKPVSENGTFSFSNRNGIQPNTNYALVLSTEKNAFKAVFPKKWAASGENINSLGKGKDALKDGVIVVNVKEKDISEIDFGLDIRPVAKDKKESTQLNPGGENSVAVPTFEGSDEENGQSIRYFISSLPDNATLYDHGKKISKAGIEIKKVNGLTLDPEDDDQNVVFTYITADHAGVVSYPATVTMPFLGLKISGNVFNDGNDDAIVEGKPLSVIEGETLYVSILNDQNIVLASTSVDPKGKYSFDGTQGIIPESEYTLVLSTKPLVKVSTLPENWEHSGEGIMKPEEGNDGLNDGVLKVKVSIKDVTNTDFGLNKKPEAKSIAVENQLNPGLSVQVKIPILTGTDLENNETLIYTIRQLPKNGQLYYANEKIDKENFVVAEPSKLTLDPKDGERDVVFSYRVTDQGGLSSKDAEVKLFFSELKISGHLFDDGNSDQNVSGEILSSVEGKDLYVLLLNPKKELLSAKAIDQNGSYFFDGKNGIKPESTFLIALATAPEIDAFGLPEGWNHTGEKINSLSMETNTHANGVIAVNIDKAHITDIDFGINKMPTADHKKAEPQLNPGRDTQVKVPTLSGDDRESGKRLIYKIESLPTLGTLYYDGNKVKKRGFVVGSQDLLTLDPDNGKHIVLFTYVTEDEAGIHSNPTRVEMAFTELYILGRVVNDGSDDPKVKGKPIRIPKKLKPYATLLDVNNTILASNPLRRDGSFSFDGKDGVYPNAHFSIVVSLEANATSSVLPAGWSESSKRVKTDIRDTNNSQENDTVGRINIFMREKSVDSIEFGLNKAPSAENKTVKPQINPGGKIRMTVPTLSGHDKEDGTKLKYMIIKVPDNATLYSKDKVVSNNDMVDPDSLTLDPEDGKLTVTFAYVAVDTGKVLSNPATVTMDFTGLSISGTIFEDFVQDGEVDSVQTVAEDEINLFMTMLSSKGEILDSVPVRKDGTYLFSQTSGVNANTNYRLVLSKDANSSTSVLPGGLNYADGENVNSLRKGNDGKADGMIDVTVKDIDLRQVDFSVNYLIQ